MKLRTIYENECQQPTPGPSIVLPPSICQRIASWSAGSIIDNGNMDKTWPFFFTAEYGLSMGRQDSYHHNMMGDGKTERGRLFSNIYNGGEIDLDTYRTVRGSAKPGVAGRVGYGLFMAPDRSSVRQDYQVFIVGFYDNEQLQWCGNAVAELVKEKIVEPDRTYVVPAEESAQAAVTLQEFMASHPIQPLPTISKPAQPERKSWQGEMSKLQPGAKWWAPTSESKQKR